MDYPSVDVNQEGTEEDVTKGSKQSPTTIANLGQQKAGGYLKAIKNGKGKVGAKAHSQGGKVFFSGGTRFNF
jgi:hypothetical protein